MKRFLLYSVIAVVPVLAMSGCASSGEKTSGRDSRDGEESPERLMRQVFESTYFALGCMANPGVDPEMTIAPIRRPSDYLRALEGTGSPAERAALHLLERNGFASFEAFRSLALRLRGDRNYWSGVDARFFEALKKCR
jgi:hypothetical protein